MKFSELKRDVFCESNQTTLQTLINQNGIDYDEVDNWDVGGIYHRKPLKIKTITTKELKKIKAKGSNKTVWSVRRETKETGTQRIVDGYVKRMKSGKFPSHDLEDVIILDGDRVVDGNHRIVSAILANRGLRYVTLSDLDESLSESFVTPYEWKSKNVVFETDGYKIAVDSTTNARYVTLWTNEGKKVGTLATRSVQDNGDEGKYLSIDWIGIDKKHQGMNFGRQMFQVLLKYMNPEYKGTVSYLPQRSNKKQIPAIYRHFKTRTDGDYEYIERESN